MALNMTLFTGGVALGLFTWLLTYSTARVWGFFQGLYSNNTRAF